VATKRVMPEAESLAFRDLLRRGLAQYRLTPGTVAPLARSKPTPSDLLGKRLGIQSAYAPLWDAGYRTDRQIAKLIENALARPVQQRRAQLALFALTRSLGAARWRRRHGFAADAWYAELRALERRRVAWAQTPWPPPKPADPDDGLIMWMHPGAVELLAEFAARALRERGFLSGPEAPQAAATIARAIAKRRGEWRDAFVDWLGLGESHYDVGVVEKMVMQPEGIELRVKKLVVQRRREGKPPGREPTHAQFVQALLHDAEIDYDASQAKRRRAGGATSTPKSAA
jgi:hypothetical protein